MMKFRVPKTKDVIDIPDELIKTAREREVIEADIKAYGDEDHWRAVVQLVAGETPDSARSIKYRVNQRVREAALIDTINRDLAGNIMFRDRDKTVADYKAIALQWLGTGYTSTPRESLASDQRTVVVVSDYHGTVHPFIEQALLQDEYDICIHAGDILDQWGMHKSRLEGKSLTMQERESCLDEEIQRMRAWFELLDEHTDAEHIVIAGNHDVRVEAAFVRLLDPLIRNESLLVRMFRTPLQLLVEGLGKFSLCQQPMNWTYPNGQQDHAADSKFIYQLGDALVSHMNFTGRQPGSAVSALWRWVQDYRHVLGLSDIRLCLQAHTHSLMLDKNCQGGHVNLVETGCAMRADALGYSLTYNGNWTPGAVGYVTFTQYCRDGQWQTDLDSVQLHGVG